MIKKKEITTKYITNPASLQNRFCYTGEEIKNYINGTIMPENRAEIALHLNVERCSRCRQLFTLIGSNSCKTEEIKDFNNKEHNETNSNIEEQKANEYTPTEQKIFERIKNKNRNNRLPPIVFNVKNRVEKGQIWTTSSKPQNMQGQQLDTVEAGVPVLIVDSGNGSKKLSNIIRVMPISFDTDFHQDGETFYFDLSSSPYNPSDSSTPFGSSDKFPNSNPLGFPFLVEIFNERPMLAGNLSRFRSIVLKADMDTIDKMLKQYRYGDDGNRSDETLDEDAINANQDRLEQIKTWQQKERELCEYLTLPVNESLQDGEDVIINVSEYRMAADDSGLSRIEEKEILIDNDDYRFIVIQKQEKIILRFDSSTIKPDSILVDGNIEKIKTSDYGEYDVEIGNTGYLPEKMVVTLVIEGENFEFQLNFNDKE